MPRLNTHEISPRQPTIHLAAGLYYPKQGQAYLFKDLRKRKARPIKIGRGKDAAIRIKLDLSVSHAHASLEWTKGNAVQIRDIGSRNGVYIDGRQIVEPVILTVGMEIRLGRTKLFATDEHGSFPISAITVSELCRSAIDRYGNCVKAGQHVGRSKDFVRRQQLPRSIRYTQFDPDAQNGCANDHLEHHHA